MNNVMQSSISCPSCGHDNFNPEKQCSCGYQADESFMIESIIMKSDKKDHMPVNGESAKPPVKSPRSKPAKEIILKEIDSWIISYSPAENVICLGTPALQNFRLKLQMNDMEELMDVLYHMSGQEKTTRKLSLSSDEINELIQKIYSLIEEKKSKMAIKFSESELQGLTKMINSKLKDSQ